MKKVDIFPFADIGPGGPYPDWIRSFDGGNGVYCIRERGARAVAYVGESHTDRLYGTLTRHFQRWSPKFNTAGPTYPRSDVEVAVVLVPKSHAVRLQNELICTLLPRDNRLTCEELRSLAEDPIPHGYDYDIWLIIPSLAGELDTAADDDVPF